MPKMTVGGESVLATQARSQEAQASSHAERDRLENVRQGLRAIAGDCSKRAKGPRQVEKEPVGTAQAEMLASRPRRSTIKPRAANAEVSDTYISASVSMRPNG